MDEREAFPTLQIVLEVWIDFFHGVSDGSNSAMGSVHKVVLPPSDANASLMPWLFALAVADGGEIGGGSIIVAIGCIGVCWKKPEFLKKGAAR